MSNIIFLIYIILCLLGAIILGISEFTDDKHRELEMLEEIKKAQSERSKEEDPKPDSTAPMLSQRDKAIIDATRKSFQMNIEMLDVYREMADIARRHEKISEPDPICTNSNKIIDSYLDVDYEEISS